MVLTINIAWYVCLFCHSIRVYYYSKLVILHVSRWSTRLFWKKIQRPHMFRLWRILFMGGEQNRRTGRTGGEESGFTAAGGSARTRKHLQQCRPHCQAELKAFHMLSSWIKPGSVSILFKGGGLVCFVVFVLLKKEIQLAEIPTWTNI